MIGMRLQKPTTKSLKSSIIASGTFSAAPSSMKKLLQISSNLFLELCPQALNPKSAQLKWRHETPFSTPVLSTKVIQKW